MLSGGVTMMGENVLNQLEYPLIFCPFETDPIALTMVISLALSLIK